MHWCVLFKQLLWRYLSILPWNCFHDPILSYYLSSKLKTKLLIILVIYFIPRIFPKTRDLKWSCFMISYLEFIGEEWLFSKNKEVFVFIFEWRLQTWEKKGVDGGQCPRKLLRIVEMFGTWKNIYFCFEKNLIYWEKY